MNSVCVCVCDQIQLDVGVLEGVREAVIWEQCHMGVREWEGASEGV